jgi:predicted dehydrogenase
MAMNLAEGRTMVDAADAAGIVFMIAQNQRYLPEHRRIKALIDQGAIGKVLAARIDGNQFLKNSYPPGHWLFSQALSGGGVIRTTAIHKLDLMRYLLGEPRRVTALHRSSGLNPGMDNEDFAIFAVEFESGALLDAFFTFAAHQNPILTASGELLILYGTQGMISNVNGWHMYSAGTEGYNRTMTSLGLPDADYNASFVNEVSHFLECIEAGQEPLSSGRDNLRTIATIDALYRAAETGQTVTVERIGSES